MTDTGWLLWPAALLLATGSAYVLGWRRGAAWGRRTGLAEAALAARQRLLAAPAAAAGASDTGTGAGTSVCYTALMTDELRETAEQAVLVALERPGEAEFSADESLAELAQLAETAGADVITTVVQRRERPHAATFIGPGKLQELKAICAETGVDLVIFDDELSPAQQRNVEKAVEVRVIDRTALILDIFAQRAQSREGKVQVELAQLNYLLPRLTGKGTELSRLGAGIGTRGPGETKLESDRRRIRDRIADLRRELEAIKAHRQRQRAGRERTPWPVVALAGYTNAGKSTLLNRLSGADVLAENRLFATLDPTTRRVELPDGGTMLLTDTVGFIQKLPTQLVAAFRATLEEIAAADLILHVIDAAHPKRQAHEAAVAAVLDELGAGSVPTLIVYNQIDRLDRNEREALERAHPDAVFVSAATGEQTEALLQRVADTLRQGHRHVAVVVPYGREPLLQLMRERGHVEAADYAADGIHVQARLPGPWADHVLSELGKSASSGQVEQA